MIRILFKTVLIGLFLSSPLYGQWKLLKDFGPSSFNRKLSAGVGANGMVNPIIYRGVECIYFLTREGAPNTGFVGVWTDTGKLHDDIWRTTDAGATWNLVFDDSNSIDLIYNFSFENTSVGYASNTQGSIADSILKTTNGGVTWFRIPAPLNLYDGYGKVDYEPATSRLFLIGSDSLWLSSNHGINWNSEWTYDNEYGVSFLNGTLGYLTGYFRDFVSTNGGVNWSDLHHTSTCWQPLALAPETFYNISFDTLVAQRSTDAGQSWSNMMLPDIGIPTGDIEGSYKRLYVIGRKGVATSTDSGNTWRPVCGPTNDHYAIHFVRGDTMYTGDLFYNLWMNPTGLDSDIRYPLLGGGVSKPQSCTPQLAYFGLYNGNSCSAVTVTKFSIWGSNRFTLLSDTSKHHQPMGISDTLSFLYNGLGVGKDTEFIAVTYTVDTDLHVDTFYMLGYRYDPFTFITTSQSQRSILTNTCDSSVSLLSILNTGCDTLHATQIHLAIGKYFVTDTTSKILYPDSTVHIRTIGKAGQAGTYCDTLIVLVLGNTRRQTLRFPLQFRIPNFVALGETYLKLKRTAECGLSLDTSLVIRNLLCSSILIKQITFSGQKILSLPDSIGDTLLAPGTQLLIPLDLRLDTAGSFNPFILFQYTANGTTTTSQIVIFLTVVAHPVLTASAPSVSFPDSCDLKNFPFSLIDSSCDSIVITSIQCNGEVTLDTMLPFPVAVQSDSSLVLPLLPVAFTKGTYWGYITVNYTSHGEAFDTIMAVPYSVISNVSPRVTISAGGIHFPLSTLCGSFDTTIYFVNSSCQAMAWSAADWTAPLADYSIVGLPSLPQILPSGASDSVRIHYVPSAAGTRSAQLHLAFQLEGIRLDTTIILSGTVVTGGITAPPLVTLDSIMPCSYIEDTVWVRNVSCDSIELTGVLAQYPAMTILFPPARTWIPSKDSVAIIFRYTPSAPGSFQGMITVSDSSNNGQQNIPIMVQGFTRAPGPDFSVLPASIEFDQIPPCVEHDTSITIVNHSQCDSLRFTSALWTSLNPSLVFDSTVLPIVLLPGDSLSLRFSIQMGPNTGLQDTCMILGDTTISIAIAASSGGAASVLDLSQRDKELLVPLCTTASTSLYFLNAGCAPIRIDSLEIVASIVGDASPGVSQFGLLGVDHFPIVLDPGAEDSVPVAFDAEANDTVLATIYFWSTATNSFDSASIMGIGTGTRRTLRFALLADEARAVVAAPGSYVALSIQSADSLPPGEAFRTVSAQLHYDDNLLTPTTFVPSNGWLLAAQTLPTPGILDLQLDRTNPNDAISMGETLGSLSCRVTAGKDSSSEIVLDSIVFNNGDTTYAHCTLAAGNSADTAWLVISPYCGSPLIRDALGGTSLIEAFSVEREPAPTSPNLLATFRLAGAAPTTLEIFDERGAMIQTVLDAELRAGRYQIPLSNLPEGVAFLRLKAGDEARIVKLALVR